MKDLNFTQEEIDTCKEFLNDNDLFGLQDFLKDHPVFNSKHTCLDVNLFIGGLARAITVEGKERAIEIIETLCSLDYNKRRLISIAKQTVFFIIAAVLALFLIVGVVGNIPDEFTVARDSSNQTMDRIHDMEFSYRKDPKTGLCFAWNHGSFAHIPCEAIPKEMFK